MRRPEVALTVKIRPQGLQLARQLFNVGTDKDLAEAMKVAPSSLGRVLAGQYSPGPKFIAHMLHAFGPEWFHTLFEIVPEQDAA